MFPPKTSLEFHSGDDNFWFSKIISMRFAVLKHFLRVFVRKRVLLESI